MTRRSRKPTVEPFLPYPGAISGTIFHLMGRKLSCGGHRTIFAVPVGYCEWLWLLWLAYCLIVSEQERLFDDTPILAAVTHLCSPPFSGVTFNTLLSPYPSRVLPNPRLASKMGNSDPALIHPEHRSVL